MRSTRYFAAGWIFLFAASNMLLGMAPDVRADSTATMATTLPTGFDDMSTVFTGSQALIFGGWQGHALNQILWYAPGSWVYDSGNTLPTPTAGSSAVWDGTDAYIFGGYDGSLYLNQIVRYTPSTGTAAIMSATLPTPTYGSSAVWDGTNAYIFGGFASGTSNDHIVRYNPSTDTVTTMTATLPTPRDSTSAIWDGSNAYIFGGGTDEIIRYNPATDRVTTMAGRLPTARSETTAVWDGSNAYIFGGEYNNAGEDIVRYNPPADSVTLMSARLPTATSLTSSIWDGSNAYVIGGDGPSSYLDHIVRYNLEPGAPQNLGAVSGLAGPITLHWQAPTGNTYFSLAGYNVYRGATSESEKLLAHLGNVVTYSDSTCRVGSSCYYQVTAYNGAGEGPKSNEASAQSFSLPSPPSGAEPCSDYNGQHGNPYPGQEGIVIQNGDGTVMAACVGTASPSQCSRAGVVIDNAVICII